MATDYLSCWLWLSSQSLSSRLSESGDLWPPDWGCQTTSWILTATGAAQCRGSPGDDGPAGRRTRWISCWRSGERADRRATMSVFSRQSCQPRWESRAWEFVCDRPCCRDCLICGCGSTSSQTRPRLPPGSPGSPVWVPASLALLVLPGANTCTATSPATPSLPTPSPTTPSPTPRPPAGRAPRWVSTRAPAPPRRSPRGGWLSPPGPTGLHRPAGQTRASRESSRLSTGRTWSSWATPGEVRGDTARQRRAAVWGVCQSAPPSAGTHTSPPASHSLSSLPGNTFNYDPPNRKISRGKFLKNAINCCES